MFGEREIGEGGRRREKERARETRLEQRTYTFIFKMFTLVNYNSKYTEVHEKLTFKIELNTAQLQACSLG